MEKFGGDESVSWIGLHVDTNDGWLGLELELNLFTNWQTSIRSFRIRYKFEGVECVEG